LGAALRPARAWIAPLLDRSPDLSLLPAGEGLDKIDRSQLHPVFWSRTSRRKFLLRPAPGVAIEACCEQGALQANGTPPIMRCEIVLGLKSGPPEALLRFAGEMNRAKPIRVEARSEAMRGYALLEQDVALRGRATYPFGPTEVAADAPVEDALVVILSRCVEHMLANDAAAEQGEIEAVHQMRVAIRRLRATFTVFEPFLAKTDIGKCREELSWLSSILGHARDWDLLEELLAPIVAAFSERDDVKTLSLAAGDKRQAAYDVLRVNLLSERYAGLVLELLTLIEARGWRQQEISDGSAALMSPLGGMAGDLLDRRLRKARKRARRFDELDPDARHDFRISLKKLRYAADSFRMLYKPATARRYVKRLACLQTGLGRLNDLHSAERLLDELAPAADAASALRHGADVASGWLRGMAKECELSLRGQTKDFLRAKRFWGKPANAGADPGEARLDEPPSTRAGDAVARDGASPAADSRRQALVDYGHLVIATAGDS
jgi:inorganic triphosphatase YgiF